MGQSLGVQAVQSLLEFPVKKPSTDSYERKKQRATALAFRAIAAMCDHELACDNPIGSIAYAYDDEELATKIMHQVLGFMREAGEGFATDR